MQRFSNANQQKSTYRDLGFWTNFPGNSIMQALLVAALLYSSGVIAESNELSTDNQMVLNSDNADYQVKVSISRAEMTAEDKNNTSVEDTQIGSFSMEDGAMMGHYGDGEYAD